MTETAALLDRAESTLWKWIAWYRGGSIEDLGGHPRGHRQMPEPLSPEDQVRVVAEANRGTFATQAQAIVWLAEQGGPLLSRNQMQRQFRILDLRKKLPRPRSTKADPEAQEAFKKRGLTALIREAALPPDATIAFADEMRLGLHGQVRRRWCSRGFKLIQPLEIRYLWRYLALAVTPTGQLWWRWLTAFRKDPVAEVVREWQEQGVDALVWDNAPAHKAHVVRDTGMPLLPLPPYSPELNPAERVFEELRRDVEGRPYGTLEAKMARVEARLQAMAANPDLVRRLAGWTWITDAITAASFL